MPHERRFGPCDDAGNRRRRPPSRNPHWGADRDRLLRHLPRLGGADAARCRGPCRRPDRGHGQPPERPATRRRRRLRDPRPRRPARSRGRRPGRTVGAGAQGRGAGADQRLSDPAGAARAADGGAWRRALVCRAARVRVASSRGPRAGAAGDVAPAIGDAGPVGVRFRPAVGPRRTRRSAARAARRLCEAAGIPGSPAGADQAGARWADVGRGEGLCVDEPRPPAAARARPTSRARKRR